MTFRWLVKLFSKTIKSRSILDERWRSSLISICSNGGCFEHLYHFDRFLGGGRVASDKLETVWFACIWMIWKARNGHALKKMWVCKNWLVRLSCCHGNDLKAMLGGFVWSIRILGSVLISFNVLSQKIGLFGIGIFLVLPSRNKQVVN